MGTYSTSQDLQVWNDRWLALKRTMIEMRSRYDGVSADTLPRKDTLLTLLEGLREFGEKQFQFFYKSFSGDPDSPKLEKSDAYPPEHILAVILSQIGFDLGVIERAAEQRLTGGERARDTLAKTDKLAWIALRPAIGKVVQPDTTVLTYFQKSAEVRVIPYANVAVIGAPYSCADVPMDFLAIPHEIGHYVFWHRDTPTLKWLAESDAQSSPNAWWLDRSAQSDPRTLWRKSIAALYRNWWQEIFADVYGCVVAGPVIAFDFQQLALENSAEDFTDLDDRHPAPILRPRIYHKVLCARSNQKFQWEGIAKQLEDRWGRKKEERGELKASVIEEPGLALHLDLEDTKPVDRMVLLALSQLKDVQSDWSGDVYTSDVESLGKRFADQYQTILSSMRFAPPDLDAPNPWSEWVNRLDPSLSQMIANRTDVPEAKWTSLFAAAGWMTGGPQDDPAD